MLVTRFQNENSKKRIRLGNEIFTFCKFFNLFLQPSEEVELKNLTDILTESQIAKLAEFGIETLEQMNYLTLAQLNQFELNVLQVYEIQKRVFGDPSRSSSARYNNKIRNFQSHWIHFFSSVGMRLIPPPVIMPPLSTTKTIDARIANLYQHSG